MQLRVEALVLFCMVLHVVHQVSLFLFFCIGAMLLCYCTRQSHLGGLNNIYCFNWHFCQSDLGMPPGQGNGLLSSLIANLH